MITDRSLISIIVPVYNVENYIDRCLKSISRQTYQNYQVIMVDDGSKDSSVEKAEKYLIDSRFEMYHKKNGGLSSARNYGLNFVRGEYVCFVDSDDWVTEEYLSILLKTILSSDADISIAEFDYAYPTHFQQVEYHLKNEVMDTHTALRKLCKDQEVTNHVWNKLYRSKLFETHKFTEGRNYEDIYIMCKLFADAKTVACNSQVVYHYFIRENSIIHVLNPQNDADRVLGRIVQYDFVTSKYPDLAKDAISLCAFDCYDLLFYNKSTGINENDKEIILRLIV